MLVDTFKALHIVKTTRAKHLECCFALLEIWFNHITLCRPLEIKGLLQEDLIKAHLRRAFWEYLKSTEEWSSFLENLRAKQLCWKPNWLNVGEIMIHGANNGLLLLVGFRCVDEYSSLKIIRQVEWNGSIQLMIIYTYGPSDLGLANQKRALRPWKLAEG